MWRRTVLAGAAALGISGAAAGACSRPEPRPGARTTRRPDGTARQPGVVTPPPAAARFVAYDLAVTGRAALGTVLRRLSDRIVEIHAGAGGGAAPGAGVAAEVTLAVGGSLFDDRFGLAAVRPRRLTPMPAFGNDVLDPARCHGDLLLQVCAGQPERVAAAAGDLARVLGRDAVPRWSVAGFRAENQVTASGRYVDRNLFGFRDGAGNLDVRDSALMDRLVWVPAGGPGGEPAWTAGGTYQVVRLIRFALALWNTEPVPRQEAVFGRRRPDGAPLGQSTEDDDPRYGRDRLGQVVPLDAHIRRANPRTPRTAGSRILRRGYSYRDGPDAAGHPDEGLVFVCFQADPERGFATVQRRLAGEALERYVLPFGGGYFFVPPGSTGDRDDFLGRGLLAAGG